MNSFTEHKTVQARILKYAEEIGWSYVDRRAAEDRRGFNSGSSDIHERCRTASLYFEDTLYAKVKEFNPRYQETEGALVSLFSKLKTDIYGMSSFNKIPHPSFSFIPHFFCVKL